MRTPRLVPRRYEFLIYIAAGVTIGLGYGAFMCFALGQLTAGSTLFGLCLIFGAGTLLLDQHRP